MTSEELKRVRCDRCGTLVSMYEWQPAKWRCPTCTWEDHMELLKLLQACKAALPVLEKHEVEKAEMIRAVIDAAIWMISD